MNKYLGMGYVLYNLMRFVMHNIIVNKFYIYITSIIKFVLYYLYQLINL